MCKMRYAVCTAFVLMFLICMELSALAQGYILNATDKIACPGVTPLYEEAGLYYTEQITLAEQLLQAGYIKSYCEDILVSIDSAQTKVQQAGGWWYFTEPELQALPLFGLTGKGVTVGIIDSGISDHQDIPMQQIIAYRNIADPENGDITDTFGHGTGVAGLICGQGEIGSGACGVAPDVNLVIAKCIEQEQTKMSDVIAAIAYCVAQGCDVMNLSLGTEAAVDPAHPVLLSMQKAVDAAVDAGCILVAAAGNNGSDLNEEDFISYPAGLKNVIGVGSLQSGMLHASNSQKNNSVFLSAPGINVWIADSFSQNGYMLGSGTSYAAPIVSGLVALIKQIYPDAGVEQVQEILRQICVDRGPAGYDIAYGYGAVSGRNLAICLRQTDFWITQDENNVFAANLSGDRTVQFVQAEYEGARNVNNRLQILNMPDMTTQQFPVYESRTQKQKFFFWDSTNLIPLAAHVDWVSN